MAAVPREAWGVVIVVEGAALAWMLLAAVVAPRPAARTRRRGTPRIDWDPIEPRDEASPLPDAAAKVAA